MGLLYSIPFPATAAVKDNCGLTSHPIQTYNNPPPPREIAKKQARRRNLMACVHQAIFRIQPLRARVTSINIVMEEKTTTKDQNRFDGRTRPRRRPAMGARAFALPPPTWRFRWLHLLPVAGASSHHSYPHTLLYYSTQKHTRN